MLRWLIRKTTVEFPAILASAFFVGVSQPDAIERARETAGEPVSETEIHVRVEGRHDLPRVGPHARLHGFAGHSGVAGFRLRGLLDLRIVEKPVDQDLPLGQLERGDPDLQAGVDLLEHAVDAPPQEPARARDEQPVERRPEREQAEHDREPQRKRQRDGHGERDPNLHEGLSLSKEVIPFFSPSPRRRFRENVGYTRAEIPWICVERLGLAAAARVAILLLVFVGSCRHENRMPAGRAAPEATHVPTAAASVPAAPTAPAGALPPQASPQGILSLTTDLPCIVTLDGFEKGRLRRNSGDTFLVPPGRHLLAAVETDSQRSWARLIDVAERQRTEVSIRFVPPMEEEAAGFRPEMPAIDFVSIAPGEFWMGSDRPMEGERHRIRISRAFEIGRFQVTQEQWKRVMRRNPTPWDLENNYEPVVNVSWEETQEFLQRLSRLDPSRLYRLPTEAEWEYVCRAGRDRDAEPPEEETRRGFGMRSPASKKANAWGSSTWAAW